MVTVTSLLPNAVKQMSVVGKAPRGRPRKRWIDCVSTDMRVLRLENEDAQDRVEWRSAVRQTGDDRSIKPSIDWEPRNNKHGMNRECFEKN